MIVDVTAMPLPGTHDSMFAAKFANSGPWLQSQIDLIAERILTNARSMFSCQ